MVFAIGAWITIAILNGAWPTYLSFIYLGLGIALFIADYFIRKQSNSVKQKLFYQCLVAIPAIFFLCLMLFN